MFKKISKKNKIIMALLSSQFIALPIIMVACNNKGADKKTNHPTDTIDVRGNNFHASDVNREGSLIGEELTKRVNEVIENSTFKLTDLAKKEYSALGSQIEKDNYIKKLWENITKWFSDAKDQLNRYGFIPDTLKNPEFQKYMEVYIPNLEYFVGNHEVHCYFDYDESQRNIYYHYKIKCLDGRQNEGQGDVFLDLGQNH
ncbi:hypothetical protein [Mycoplasma phocoeninasale]|uniref:Uncharacterized protein n=1 Tax=Mycoplasma phocoeninasale TaxID=2726117 RepID=A0A858U6V4_9MOLU|nr:hypothetical protein [Mycoplasma phocoeninasale]MBN0970418.1 hypothetical protein [Mycoplasma phocoeninasale]QJG66456.1 hypothetical protein HGG64_01920 [Mycoplasma phocoeninasale]